MPLNFADISCGLNRYISSLPQKLASYQQDASLGLEKMHAFATDQASLTEKVKKLASQDVGVRCLIPTGESVNASFPIEEDAFHLSDIAAIDGSQIIPEYGLPFAIGAVNIAMVNRHNLQHNLTRSILVTSDEHPQIRGGDDINLYRDILERRLIFSTLSSATNKIVLTDGPLHVFRPPEHQHPMYVDFTEFLSQMQIFTSTSNIIAGYVDSPASRYVVSTLELAEYDESYTGRIRDYKPYANLSDSMIFSSLLEPKHRSAVFEIQSKTNRLYPSHFQPHCFYLNTSQIPCGQQSIARVEIPRWVAQSNMMINALHSELVTEIDTLGNICYPYLLLRAHEDAVLTQTDQAYIESRVAGVSQQYGYINHIAEKNRAKGLLKK